MGYTTSTVHGIQVPDSAQANNIPTDLGLIVSALEGGSLVKRLTQAQINALTSPQKPSGLLVWNSTTNKLQVSNGTSFVDIDASALLKAGGTMSGNIAMGGNKVTGLAAASANGEAVRYEQAVLGANVRSGTVGATYATGGVAVSFSSAMPTTPKIVIGNTVNVGGSTPVHYMPFAVTTSGFTVKAFFLGGSEYTSGLGILFDYFAIVFA